MRPTRIYTTTTIDSSVILLDSIDTSSVRGRGGADTDFLEVGLPTEFLEVVRELQCVYLDKPTSRKNEPWVPVYAYLQEWMGSVYSTAPPPAGKRVVIGETSVVQCETEYTPYEEKTLKYSQKLRRRLISLFQKE